MGTRLNKSRGIAHPVSLDAAPLAGILAMTAAFALYACSASAPQANRTLSIAAGNAEINLRAEGFKQALLARDRSLVSMRTPAIMEYTAAGQHIKAREEIVVRRPASLRVEAFSPFGVAAVVAANGSQVAIFDPAKNLLMRGDATARTLDRFAQIPLAPGPAVNLLLGLAPDANLLSASVDAARNEGNLLILTLRKSDGSSSELGFADGQLALVRQRGAAGGVRCEVRYSRYQDIGGLKFAYHLDADFPATGTHVKFTYERPIVNGVVSDSLFVLSPGPATREIDLDNARLS